jgi:hypothetical protein
MVCKCLVRVLTKNQMAGEPIVELDWDHPFSPSLPTEPLQNDQKYMETSSRDSSGKPSGMPVTQVGNPNTHQAHYCYVPGIDLLVIQIFNFGLDEEGYWKWRVSGTGEARVRCRLTDGSVTEHVHAAVQDGGPHLVSRKGIHGSSGSHRRPESFA